MVNSNSKESKETQNLEKLQIEMGVAQSLFDEMENDFLKTIENLDESGDKQSQYRIYEIELESLSHSLMKIRTEHESLLSHYFTLIYYYFNEKFDVFLALYAMYTIGIFVLQTVVSLLDEKTIIRSETTKFAEIVAYWTIFCMYCLMAIYVGIKKSKIKTLSLMSVIVYWLKQYSFSLLFCVSLALSVSLKPISFANENGKNNNKQFSMIALGTLIISIIGQATFPLVLRQIARKCDKNDDKINVCCGLKSICNALKCCTCNGLNCASKYRGYFVTQELLTEPNEIIKQASRVIESSSKNGNNNYNNETLQLEMDKLVAGLVANVVVDLIDNNLRLNNGNDIKSIDSRNDTDIDHNGSSSTTTDLDINIPDFAIGSEDDYDNKEDDKITELKDIAKVEKYHKAKSVSSDFNYEDSKTNSQFSIQYINDLDHNNNSNNKPDPNINLNGYHSNSDSGDDAYRQAKEQRERGWSQSTTNANDTIKHIEKRGFAKFVVKETREQNRTGDSASDNDNNYINNDDEPASTTSTHTTSKYPHSKYSSLASIGAVLSFEKRDETQANDMTGARTCAQCKRFKTGKMVKNSQNNQTQFLCYDCAS